MYLILIIIVLILFASATIIRRAASHVSQVLREREEIRFATNSLVEGGGFEPSVPRLGWAQLPRAGQCEGVSPLQGFEPSVARKRDNGLQPQKLAPGDELGATISETQRDFDVFAADGTLPVFRALILRRAGYKHDCFDIMKQTQYWSMPGKKAGRVLI